MKYQKSARVPLRRGRPVFRRERRASQKIEAQQSPVMRTRTMKRHHDNKGACCERLVRVQGPFVSGRELVFGWWVDVDQANLVGSAKLEDHVNDGIVKLATALETCQG